MSFEKMILVAIITLLVLSMAVDCQDGVCKKEKDEFVSCQNEKKVVETLSVINIKGKLQFVNHVRN